MAPERVDIECIDWSDRASIHTTKERVYIHGQIQLVYTTNERVYIHVYNQEPRNIQHGIVDWILIL